MCVCSHSSFESLDIICMHGYIAVKLSVSFHKVAWYKLLVITDN